MSRTRQGQLHSNYRKTDRKLGFHGQTISSADILKVISEPCSFCGTLEKVRGCRRLDQFKPHSIENCVSCCLSCTRRGATMSTQALTYKSVLEVFKAKYKAAKTSENKQQTTHYQTPHPLSYINIDRGGVRSDECVNRRGGEAPPHSFLGGPKLTHPSLLIAATTEKTEERKKEKEESQQIQATEDQTTEEKQEQLEPEEEERAIQERMAKQIAERQQKHEKRKADLTKWMKLKEMRVDRGCTADEADIAANKLERLQTELDRR